MNMKSMGLYVIIWSETLLRKKVDVHIFNETYIMKANWHFIFFPKNEQKEEGNLPS